MANVLSREKRITCIGALAEGSSIRSIERLTGVHGDTIGRLAVRVGKACASIMDEKMRGLNCKETRFVAVLEIAPVASLNTAVRVAIKSGAQK